MIQMLTYDGKSAEFIGDGVVINRIHDAQSLDEFEVNIINLNDDKIWRSKEYSIKTIDIIEDFKSLSLMIQKCKMTKILILLPQNITYKYYYVNKHINGENVRVYDESCELKNMFNALYNILDALSIYLGQIHLVYENTYTNISEEKINAAFFFDVFADYGTVLLKSEKSQKPTAIALNDIMITSTLYVKNYNEVMCLLMELKLIQNKQSVPLWMEDIKMFDDSQQLSIIEKNNNTIKIANDNISKAMEKINKNNEYKSILYTNGDELVKVVFEILETMLGCDLSEFDDKKKEDFLFEIDDFVFIGEIKGVNHNVKSENVSQLEVHYQGYVEDNNKDENQIKAILIMNHQKNKSLDTREPVHEKQIGLADRNGSLIVETITLLKLFERYLSDDLSREECIELLKSKKGLLTI